MSAAVKQEFYRWIESLDSAKLNKVECKFLNLLITHFNTLMPLSTAGGLRAKKIGELIQKHHSTLSESFPDIKSSNTDGFDKSTAIGSLKIGPFRGFTRSESFVFDKKYTFMYGPNGSGKSSFCEGLEYALLGDIEEAAAKRIAVDQYIKNEQKRYGVMPEAYTTDYKTKIEKNQAYYRFAFIEKNRIDGFARIAATTPGVQKDRIATLFGLDAFSGFVDGFTDELNDKHLVLKNSDREKFEKELTNNAENEKKIIANKEKLSKFKENIQTLIKETGQKQIKSIIELKEFLNGTDGISGYLAELRRKETEIIPDDIKLDILNRFTTAITTLACKLDEFKVDIAKLAQLSSNVNFQDLYLAIERIEKSEDTDTACCPACKTPITNTTINPFKNAVEELKNLQSLTTLQENIKAVGIDLSERVRILGPEIKGINTVCSQVNYSGNILPLFTEFVFSDIATIHSWLPQIETELTKIIGYSNELQTIRSHVVRYNEDLAAKRALKGTKTETLQKYVDINTRCIETSTSVETLKKENETLQEAIDGFASTNSKKLQEIEAEDKKVEINQQFADAYSKLILHLRTTRDLLPSRYSDGLSVKTREFYNIINSDDPDFEKIDNLTLPVMSNNKIEIQFLSDSSKHDALQILSEGHIKVLGLSILLAKAVSENLGFLVFDDIVNAIDDDHRDGIAELLMRHPDMCARQIIVTCHGDTFLNKLEHKLGASEAGKHVKSFQFVPIDVVQERGVQVSIGNSKHYILKAEEYWQKNSLKDSATECRRAVESISTQLWKKLDKKLKVNLTVTMRAPGYPPDLATVVDSLLKELGKICGTENLHAKLSDLKTKYPWSLLNKGVHEDDKQPEFERTDMKNLILLIKEVESLVERIKVQATTV